MTGTLFYMQKASLKQIRNALRILCRHLSIFPGRRQPSIFDVKELNFCVRNGNRWNLFAISTDYL